MLAIMFLAVLSFEGLSAKNAFVPDSKVLCANNGIGYSNGVTTFCKCKPYTTGKACEITITTTQCAPVTTSTACSITTTQTNTPCNPCAINPCQNNGQCYNSGNCQATCSCAAGWAGQFCQYRLSTQSIITTTPCVTTTPQTFNPCQVNPCQNNGQCYYAGQVTCSCAAGFYGQFCQYMISSQAPISTTACYSTTITTPLSTTTQCNPCQYNNGGCQNGGMCFNNNCAPACQCPNGYFGAMCQYQVSQPSVTTSTACYTTTTTTTPLSTTTQCNPCQYNNGGCQNGGMCFNNNCAPACQCPNGYFGAMCQYQVSQPSVTTSTACYTTTTTTTSCAQVADVCKNNQCQNGQCMNQNGNAYCQCFPGWVGQFCQYCSNQKLAQLYRDQLKSQESSKNN